jgi:6-phosphogluconolactonase
MRIYDDLEALSRAVAEELTARAGEKAATGRSFGLVLAGGSTPRTLYRLLATDFRERMPWPRVHLLWGDERFVPADHPDSNRRMAEETLISRVPIPPANVHPIPQPAAPGESGGGDRSEAASPEEAAARYEEELRRLLEEPAGSRAGSRIGSRRGPGFDAVLLGVGEDGHTASLFPGDTALDETERWVRAVPHPPAPHEHPRVTLTLPALARAEQVLFLAAGERKRAAVRSIAIRRDADDLPAARVRCRGPVEWLIDRAAAPEPQDD